MTSSGSERNWIKIWGETHLDRIPEWDQLADAIFSLLLAIVPSLVGKKVLEVGSGTGRISMRISELEETEVILVDVSRKIMEYSKRLAGCTGSSAKFIVASVFALPIRSGCLDLVWSAGLLEHFGSARQQSAISECLRSVKKLGKTVAIVPNKGSLVYNWLRVLSVRLGKWPYGYEEPLSRTNMDEFCPKPDYICSAHGFFQQSSLTSISRLTCGRILKHVVALLQLMLEKTLRLFSLILPGYLLIGVFIKR
jgi:SAM-dependent methyltransferase